MLTGSVAAGLYGVPVAPRDFDIAPRLSEDNLQQLASLLAEWGAKPMYHPNWEGSLSLEAIELWQPFPATPENLDHLMVTPYGPFDVVPKISGEYDDLLRRSLAVETFGMRINVAHPDDLIATLKPTAQKHIERFPHLREAQHRVSLGHAPRPFESVFARR